MNNFTFTRTTFLFIFGLFIAWSTASAQTLYSFKSGDYNDPKVWTLNSSGIVYDNQSALTPVIGSTGDAVVILSGRTVTINPSFSEFPAPPTSYSVNGPAVTVQEGAILEIASNVPAIATPSFASLDGQGTLLMHSTANFPSGISSSTFMQTGGGTVEYNFGVTLELPANDTYNNLTINLTSGAKAIVSRLLTTSANAFGNFTLNGNLHVKQGTFQIGKDTTANSSKSGYDSRLNISIAGDVIVNAGAAIGVGTMNTNNANLTATEFGGHNLSKYSDSTKVWSEPFQTGPFYIIRDSNYKPNSSSRLPFKSGVYHKIHHQVYIGGSMTNNGTVKFHNLTTLNLDQISGSTGSTTTTSGAATVFFRGLADDTLTCNGITDFYNLVLDKGSDPTYSLTINPSNYTYFRLWGPTSIGADLNNFNTPNGSAQSNPIMRKSLWISNGTLKLTGKTVIPSLSESGDDFVGHSINNSTNGPSDPSGDFYVPTNGAMVLDSPDVIVLTTADYASEVAMAYGLSTANVQGVFKDQYSGNQSLSIYGAFTINSGYISGRESGGIIYWSTAGGAGNFTINGGVVDAKQFRSAEKIPAGRATFTINGGLFRLRGRFQNFSTAPPVTNATGLIKTGTVPDTDYSTIRALNGYHAGISTFNIATTANVFTMAGGNITVLDVGTDATQRIAFEVNSSSANTNVTGGTVTINVVHGIGKVNENFPTVTNDYADADYHVKTLAPVYNLNINRSSTGTKTVVLYTQPLIVKNNLTVNSGVFNANSLNVTIGKDFNLYSAAQYITGTNTTTFNGSGNQNFLYSSNSNITFTGSTLGLKNLSINKTAGTLAMGGNGTDLTVNGSLSLLNGIFDDGGVNITVKDTVTNSATHTSTNGGKIILAGTASQTINGNGNGIFANLQLNNANGAKFINAGQTVSGQLRLENGILDIGIYPLAITSSLSTAISPNSVNGLYSNTNMIRTSGNQSDGGIIKKYGDVSPFIFPVGTFNGTSYDYTPATIAVTATTYGSITVKPVSKNHPFATGNNNLNRYWKVIAGAGFSPNPTVSHTYQYVSSDVSPTMGADVSDPYLAAVFNPNTWVKGANVPGNNTFSFPNLTYITGEFTSGKSNNFGVVTAFYSRNNGNWNTPATWSIDPILKWSGTAASSFPTASNPVYIGDGALKNHVVTISTPNQSAGILQLSTGSILNVGTTTGHDFGALDDSLKITGAGKLRISTNALVAEFPKGDFGNFLGASGGTVEYYDTTTSVNYTIPQISADNRSLATYYNLTITPSTGRTITMPDQNIRLYGDLTVNGASSTGIAQLNDISNTVARTLTINGSISIAGGRLRFMNNAIRNIVLDGFRSTTLDANGRVDGRITIGSNNGAGFDMNNTFSTINTISLVGSIINNGFVDFNPGSLPTRICNVTFIGTSNEAITGDNTVNTSSTKFGQITVNKGTSHSAMLTLSLTGTKAFTVPAVNWLTLQNGTFRYVSSSGNSILDLSNNAGTIQIPATARFIMEASTPTNSFNIANKNNDGADLLLNGKLKIISGILNVGPSSATASNNDIEYAAAGQPEIEVTGGRLYVNGQIRRPAGTNITLGSLVYNQSGGNVIIGGNSSAAGLAVANTRAKFEIDNGNNGSKFNMSGGTLTILKGNGNVSDYGDLYIHPGTSTITGGTIIMAPTITSLALSSGGNQLYTIDSNVDLMNVTIGDSSTYSSIAQLNVNPLRLKGDLNIKFNSTLDSKGLNVQIGGFFTNSGIYLPRANTTTFNGNANTSAKLNSPTAFNNLTINKSGGSSLTLAGSSFQPAVLNTLTLTNGILNDGGRTLLTMGNIVNSGLHTSTGGKIDLQIGVQSITFTQGSYRLPSITGPNGSGATFKMTITDGKISAITVASGGSGYTSGNLIIGNESGAGALATFIATPIVGAGGGVITSVTVTNGGSGYGPIVTFDNSNTGNNAIVQTILSTNSVSSSIPGTGIVSAVNLVYPGSDYNSYPTITVSPDAAITAVIVDIFSNSTKNILSGNGSGQFGNLSINNSAGAELTDNMTVNGVLNLAVDGPGSDGLLYLNNNKLTLGVNATIIGVSITSTQRFIRTNGVLSDGSLEKVFANYSNQTFLFPVGVAGKYTPANYTLTTGAIGGNITVKPINAKHPNVNLSLGSDLDPDYVNYYWNVNSTVGNLTSLTHKYYYVADVEKGIPANYVSARFNNALWTKGLSTDVDEVNRIINFNATSLSGDYTAGESTIFENPATYTSNAASMTWESTNWTSSPNVGNGPPKEGSIVFIRPSDVVTVNQPSKVTNSLTINGTLDLGSTDLHNFGTVTGSGLLRISGNNTDFAFPAGNYDAFTSNTGGTVEYYGSVSGTLLTQRTFNKLIFSGNSTKEMIQNILVNDSLIINAGIFSNTSYNKDIILKGNWVNNVGTPGFASGSGTITFNRGTFQSIGPNPTIFNNITLAGSGTSVTNNANLTANGNLTIGNGASLQNTNNVIDLKGNWTNNGSYNAGGLASGVILSGTNQLVGGSTSTGFKNLTITGGGNKTLNQITSVDGQLTLTDGYIISTSSNFLKLGALANVIGTSDNSFVVGPLTKDISMASPSHNFTFPVGKIVNGVGRYAQIDILKAGDGTFTAEYFAATPTNNGNYNSPLTGVSDVEYWNLTSSPNTVADVKLTFRPSSNFPAVTSPASKVYAVRYNSPVTDVWNDITTGSDINTTSGDITASNVNAFGSFTFGFTSSEFVSLPVRLLTFQGKWNNDKVDLEWITTSEENNSYFEVERSADAQHFVTIGGLDGKGTTNFTQRYQFTDGIPLPGVNYYRLKQVDSNGDFEYSKTISIVNPAVTDEIVLYPNPVSNSEQVSLRINSVEDKAYLITIHDVQGKIITSNEYSTVKGMNELLILQNIHLVRGMYFVRVQAGSANRQFKLIVD